MKTERVEIFDTTLRDGEQSPGCSMNLEEKVRLARKLEGLGVDPNGDPAAGVSAPSAPMLKAAIWPAPAAET